MTDDRRFEQLFLPALFLLSGISGLVYQVVWMRMLIRVFGITIYATSTVIAVFMGGLAFGSWIAGKYVTRGNPTLRTYAKIELGIAVSAMAATVAMKALPAVYASAFGGELGRTGGASATEVGLRLLLSDHPRRHGSRRPTRAVLRPQHGRRGHRDVRVRLLRDRAPG